MGILDKYCYTYDNMGNKIAVRKERKGLPEESGNYDYRYDVLNRLTGVEKDGMLLRRYHYDSFGNRISMEDYKKGIQSACTYDALNRLIQEEIWENSSTFSGESELETQWSQDSKEKGMKKSYTFDRRGNLIGVYQEGELLHGYKFGALNLMEKAWDSKGREVEYLYNGLGQRTGRRENSKAEKYVLDLTKPYHNLLAVEEEEKQQNFYWDFGVAVIEENGGLSRSYLQDEMGSPLRILYGNGNGDIYGYDEFGGELNDHNLENGATLKKYSRQGETQPFGYTGYRYDAVSGTYFAQAREYWPELGRFIAEDVIRGNGAVPKTLNRYIYCWNQPLNFVDRNGKDGYYFYDPDMFPTLDTEAIMEMDVEYLEEKYNTEIHVIAMDTEKNPDYTSFQDSWNNMDKDIDVVVFMTHSNNQYFVTDSTILEDGTRKTTAKMYRDDIIGLNQKSISDMYLIGCNMGLTDTQGEKNSLASTFYSAENRQDIGMIFACDGSIMHGIDQYGKRIFYAIPNKTYHPDGIFDGFKVYYMEDSLRIEKLEDTFLDMEYISSKGYDNEECENGGKIKDEKEKKK